MAKNIIIIILVLAIAIICFFLFVNNPPPKTKPIIIKGQKFHLEIASTIPQKTKGLMNRQSLCPNCGMIFISGFEMPQAFWMKNTLIPLDIIFINKNGVVINIETASPQPNTPDNQLQLYKSTQPTQYVIELNASVASTLSLRAGDTIDLSSFHD